VLYNAGSKKPSHWNFNPGMPADNSEKQPTDPIHALSPFESQVELEQLLAAHQQHLEELPESATSVDRARIALDIAETMLGLGRNDEAWDQARSAFDVFVKEEAWQDAAEACDILYRADQAESIVALANGTWLSVTYPVKPETSVALLQHIVDETPDDSDGGAVAATVAHYIADFRAEDARHESLTFLTTQILARVAKRHRGIEDQATLNTWMAMLQLDDPAQFLPKLAQVLDVMAGDNWWYDRDTLRARLPVN
jgi:hypothetical protein